MIDPMPISLNITKTFNPHYITKLFEQVVADYTGSPFCVATDNCSNALFLCLHWYTMNFTHPAVVTIPQRTYPSVPCEIIRAGFRINYLPMDGEHLVGEYPLSPLPIWDSALRFTSGMYRPGQFQCLSFTGPKKHLKLSKGGMILTDNEEAYRWFKKARFSGRSECSYHEDDFDNNPVLGYNYYMMPELAARGLLLMTEFPKHNEDLRVRYPDLSKFKIFQS